MLQTMDQGLSTIEMAAWGDVRRHLFRLDMETPPGRSACIARRALERRAGDFEVVIQKALAEADELGILVND